MTYKLFFFEGIFNLNLPDTTFIKPTRLSLQYYLMYSNDIFLPQGKKIFRTVNAQKLIIFYLKFKNDYKILLRASSVFSFGISFKTKNFQT